MIAIVAVTILVTGVVSYTKMTENARATVERYLIDELEELYGKNASAEYGVKALVKVNNESMLARARNAAEIIRLTPGILSDMEALQALCNSCGAESIIICDKAGRVKVSTPERMVGQVLDADYQELIKCAEGKIRERALQAPALDNSERYTRFAAVRMKDSTDVLALAFYPGFELAAQEKTNLTDLVKNASIGANGFLIAFDRGEPYSEEELPTTEAELRAIQLDALTEHEYNGVPYFTYAMKRNGLRLIAFVPEAEYFGNRTNDLWLQFYSTGLLLVILLVGLYIMLRRRVLKPLEKLTESVRDIGGGKFDERVHMSDSTEFVKLSQSLNIMLDSLRSAYDLATEQAQHELSLARAIKEAVLPKPGELTANRSDVSMAITLVQADTVGGDFYDCLMTDDDHLLFIIGSIAEQGVPAALYMMRGLAIIRNYVGTTDNPQELAELINVHVCKGDNANIRVSMFIGQLEISSGRMVCVNAGQHAPMLQREGQEYEVLPVPVSPVLGKTINADYEQYTFTMNPGDRFFTCTSALTCMANDQKELFGEQRLQQALHEVSPTIKDVGHLVRTAMRRFIRQAQRTKDYTMVALELPGPRRSGGSIVVTPNETPKALRMIEKALEEVFAAPNDITNILEATSNVMGAIPADAQVRVVLGCTEKHARVTLSYTGAEKNILEGLPPMRLDSAAYHHAQNVNDIILHNNLG